MPPAKGGGMEISMLICVTNGDTNSSKRSVAMKNEIVLAGKLIEIIEASRNNALRKVNEELIRMYWSVGEYLSAESKNVVFGDKYIDTIAKEIQVMFPGIKGFNRRGLYRMKQFYELYKDNLTVSPLVTQISWTNHLLIMSGCKSDE